MQTWKRICCAVDLSEVARLALRQAAHLARWLDGELVILHVVVRPAELSEAPLSDFEAERSDVDTKLAAWRDEVSPTAGHPISIVVRSGLAALEILNFVENERVDVLVVGTQGREGVKRALYGSVAEQVVRRSPCPVVVVNSGQVAAGVQVENERAEIAQYQ